jgi:hypothetical protein
LIAVFITTSPAEPQQDDSAFYRKEKEKNPANIASIPHFQSVHPELVSGAISIFV